MKPGKLHILSWLIKLRLTRLFCSNRVINARVDRWRKTLSKSVFYHQLIEARDFPVMNKEKFMLHFDEINTVGITKAEAMRVAMESERSRDFSPSIGPISVGLSSGTSGNKGIFLTSPREKAIWVAAVLDRVIGFSLKKRRVAFFLRANNNLYESVRSNLLSFTFFDIKIPIDTQIDKLIGLNPDILVAQPSVLYQIAKNYNQKAITHSFSKIISVAEVLEADQKAYFQKVFGCRVDQVYQCTEGFLAYTCKDGQLHFNEDWLEIEKRYLDGSHTRFHPIITDYLRTSQPIVRYELNDIIHEGAPCTCGSQSTVIDRIEGRSDDVFQFQTGDDLVLIYPDFIRRAVISASDEVMNYLVRQTSKTHIDVSLEIRGFEAAHRAFEQVKGKLTDLLLEYGVEGVRITSSSYQHDPMTKFTRIKNDCSSKV